MKLIKQIVLIGCAIIIFNCSNRDKKPSINKNNLSEVSRINGNNDTKEIQDITPKAVKENFKNKYPGEDDPDWRRDDKGNWESHFKIDGVSYRADYNDKGEWIETETSIDKSDLPKAIKDVIKKEFKDDEISEIELVDHHSKGIFYDVEFKRKGKNLDIEFKENGEIISN